MNVDISNEQAVGEAWRTVISRHGKVNLLVNNAARALGREFSELTCDMFRKTMDINFSSIVQLTKLFLGQPGL